MPEFLLKCRSRAFLLFCAIWDGGQGAGTAESILGILASLFEKAFLPVSPVRLHRVMDMEAKKLSPAARRIYPPGIFSPFTTPVWGSMQRKL